MQDGSPSPPQKPATPGADGGQGGLSGAEFAGVGVQFAASILLFLWVGQWLDRRFGTAPWGLIIGVFTGAGGAFYAMHRKLMAAQRADDERRRSGP